MPLNTRPVTQKQIAERVGVTQQLVALALNGSSSVAQSTRGRILEVAQELGYSRNSNRHARNMAASRHGTRMRNDIIAVVFEGVGESPAAGNPYFRPFLDGIELEASERRLDLFLVPSRPDGLPWFVREGWTDGIIFLGSHAHLPEVGGRSVPRLVLGGLTPGEMCITAEDEKGTYLVTNHLLNLGHTRIAYLGPRPPWPSAQARMEGFLRALTEADVEADPLLLHTGLAAPFSQQGREGMAELLTRNEGHLPFTALVCHNDPVAMGATRLALAAGKSVPGDISITGFDDVSSPLNFSPSITSVSFPGVEMGRRAVVALCEAIERRGQTPEATLCPTQFFPVELKIRKSSAPPTGAARAPHYLSRSFMNRIQIKTDYDSICQQVAARIATLIQEKPNAVLGLATGSTPIGVYQELIRLHCEEGLSFSQVRTFNLDEYYPISPDAAQSYLRFMREQLFDHVDITPGNWHLPDGTARSLEQIDADCEAYEAAIADAGGLDLQLLGIGRTGHIGFNEPGSPQDSHTRLVTLDHVTRADAASDFFGLENVPVRAITMGVGTILGAREIILVASGEKKAAIVAEALEGKITSKVPASFLREHEGATFYLDEASAAELTVRRQPWRVQDADFTDPALRRQSLISVALETNRSLEQLAAEDLMAAGASRLVDSPQALKTATTEVLSEFVSRLDDELHLPRNQKILCLSPHPDDDVICCGATLTKLAERGNSVYVCFGVSGANAVRDKDVLALLRARHPRLVSFLEENLPPGKTFEQVFDEVRQFIFERESGQSDVPMLRDLKRLVREGEASDACRKMGAKPIFWDLPFYHSDHPDAPVTEADITIALESLQKVQPDLVLLTGELNDPHGTHEKCVRALELASVRYRDQGGAAFKRWKYRGAWDEWRIWEGTYFSVFDKARMEKKIGLILDHISQLDPLFPGGSDPREFYERARDRNRQTARELQKLGVLPPSRSFDPLYAEVFVEA